MDGDVGRVPEPRDVQAINNLLFAYAKYTDAGQGEPLAALFTDDARWDGDDLGFGSASGPAAIVALVTAHHDPAQPMMHLPGPAALTCLDDGTVEVQLWCLATRWMDGVPMPHIHFKYTDVVRRTGDRWQFASRTLHRVAPG
jgi:hypothetical protein